MRFHRMVPTLTLAVSACALGAVPVATASAATDVQQASSENWSGYVVGDSDQSTTYKTVTGSWVQPAATCKASDDGTYAAFWVGLGGADGKTALEQDGTEANCSTTGVASYYAWYELVPKAPVKVDLAVHAGDHMTATTTVDGHAVTETIDNDTTGQSFTKTLTMNSPDTSSAEWITEAPSQCEGSVSDCTALPLSDFHKVTFTSASATDSSGHTGSISDSDWQTDAVTLSSGASSMGGAMTGYAGNEYSLQGSGSGSATPSSLSSNGSSFSVSYRKSSNEVSTSGDGYGYGYGYGGGGSGSSTSGYGYGGGSGYGYGGGSAGFGYGASGYGGYSYGEGSAGGYGYGGGSTAYGAGGDGGYIVIYTY
jgi:hypothetical protein